MIGWIFFAKSKIISSHLDSFQRFASAACFYLTSDWFTVVYRRSLSLTSFPAWLFFFWSSFASERPQELGWPFVSQLALKRAGKGQGKARGECWEERIIYICCEFICLWKKSSYSEETTTVFVWFRFFDSWKKKKLVLLECKWITFHTVWFLLIFCL